MIHQSPPRKLKYQLSPGAANSDTSDRLTLLAVRKVLHCLSVTYLNSYKTSESMVEVMVDLSLPCVIKQFKYHT